MLKSLEKAIIICGYPKSGNTWIGYIMSYYYNVTYLDAHYEEARISQEGQSDRAEKLMYNRDGFIGGHQRPDQKNLGYTSIIKSHHHPSQFAEFHPRFLSKAPIPSKPILILREPKDAAVSYFFHNYFHLPLVLGYKHGRFSVQLRLIVRKILYFDNFVLKVAREWRDFHQMWQDTPHHPVKYEDLIHDTYGTMYDLILKLDGEVNEKYLREAVEYCRFQNLKSLENKYIRAHSRHESFFREGRTGSWRKYFRRSVATKFQATLNEVYTQMGYGECPRDPTKNVVISVDHISKEYRLGTIGTGTLFRDLQTWWAQIRGLPNPNSKIDTEVNDVSIQGLEASQQNRRFMALNNVSFQVEKGEVLGIIGRNGAGKSTLLKILSRVTAPTHGKIRLKGRVASLLEVGTGFHPELTGRENIYLNGAILGMTHGEVTSKLQEIIQFAEIAKFVDTPVKRYSSGMYVRLAFAVAAHLDPEILIIDEVLAVGDVQFQNKCLGKMQDVSSKEGRTVLFVSHNMGLISSICKRAILLEGGRVVADGYPSEVILRYYSSGTSSPAQVDFIKLGQKIGDSYARLLSGCVRDTQGKINNDFLLEQEVVVEMVFQILQRREFNRFRPYPSLHVYGTSGECVFFTSSPNPNNRVLDPGVYRAVCRIPAYFLNTGTYFVGFGFANCDKGVDVHFYERNAISFHIREDLSLTVESRNGYGGSIPGLLRPKIDWAIELNQLSAA